MYLDSGQGTLTVYEVSENQRRERRDWSLFYVYV